MKEHYFLLFLVLFNLNVICKKIRQPPKLSQYSSDIGEDSNLDTAELIQKYKYPVETHYVNTKDGYILRLHRIPRPNAKPFFLQHGILDSSGTFVFMSPKKSLAYFLHDMDYDVWMGNARGNRYSRNHTTLNPDVDMKFWNFSWHEIGIYDIPAMIDYILNVTKFKKLFYVGHSQGTTAFWVMCSMLPQYNEKIELMHALAPVAYLSKIKSPFIDAVYNMFQLPVSYNFHELLPRSTHFLYLCMNNQQTQIMCAETLSLLFGRNPDEFNMTMLPVTLGHEPAGAATKQLRHYLQLYKSGRFCQYDYFTKNSVVYKNDTPPDYPLEKIVAPVILYYSLNDYLTTDSDIFIMADRLSNLIEKYKIPNPLWNHADFLWAINAKKITFDVLLNKTKTFENTKRIAQI